MRPGRAVLGVVLAVGCAPVEPLIVVDLRTDFVPGVEVATVETILYEEGSTAGTAVMAEASPDADYVTGVRIAEYDGAGPGTHRVRVRLREGDGALLVERDTSIVYDGGVFALTVVVSRSCRDVRCPGAGDSPSATACLGGRCVPETCSVEDPSTCGPSECEADADCPAAEECAAYTCLDGVCLARASAMACAAGEWCSPEHGCVPLESDCVEGAACATGDACELGQVDCSTGRAVCRGTGPATAGTPCRAAGGECDVPETCDGVSTRCPADVLRDAGTACRPSTAPCDAAELCSGSEPTCPPDAATAAETVCRPSELPCDAPEVCDGSSTSCPPDAAPVMGCSAEYRTAGTHTFVVPIACTRVRIRAWGAGGGNGLGNTRAAAGGYSDATVATTPGETLTVAVGGPGSRASGGTGAAGGLHGGGRGGSGSSQGGGGGGGFSGVFRDAINPTNALVIAGGGGGSGGGASGFSGAGGGAAGQSSSGDGPGGGGTQLAGGAAGVGGTAGSALQGGGGGGADSDGGGGGGGGWFGGGGGQRASTDAGGAGGGSGFIAAGATAVVSATGDRGTPGNAIDPARMGAGAPGAAGAVLIVCP